MLCLARVNQTELNTYNLKYNFKRTDRSNDAIRILKKVSIHDIYRIIYHTILIIFFFNMMYNYVYKYSKHTLNNI